MAFSERDSKERNLSSKKMYVERGNSEACQCPLLLPYLMLQLARVKTAAGQTIEVRKHWMKKALWFPSCTKNQTKPNEKPPHNPQEEENVKSSMPGYTHCQEGRIFVDDWR